MVRRFFSVVICVLLLSACGAKERIVAYDEQDAKTIEIKQEIEKMNNIHKAKIIVAGNDILVAIEVKPLHAFKEQKIARNLQKELEKKWEHNDVLVSSDFKLLWEADKLMAEQNEQKVTEKIEKLKKLAKEET
ncbi:YhcN/YlaJ family sporulation lipoprotein [Metasolibacillus meyeri]|uniref:YhcN/YlaJ family sporulation lipoprotein n=1 Tax=Metasolibacillus meyeri TaxID=1071052 RepID=A0AAW9NV57_9BACL|nr:YhcN/YlaJ family sporulation lipoprotein [Metasolibacillus meyeri]MEC1178796.1 YhcN/YlaJ family sporulation lipoprotein [Metasolibacillus meyeri]